MLNVKAQQVYLKVDTFNVEWVILNDSINTKLYNKTLISNKMIFLFSDKKSYIVKDIFWKMDNKQIDVLIFKKQAEIAQ